MMDAWKEMCKVSFIDRLSRNLNENSSRVRSESSQITVTFLVWYEFGWIGIFLFFSGSLLIGLGLSSFDVIDKGSKKDG